MFMLPATLGMTGLFIFQMYLVKANTTNIETFEVELAERDSRNASHVRKVAHPCRLYVGFAFLHFLQPYRWIYDRGAWENLQEVLGHSTWAWLVPAPVAGDGLRWRARSSLTPALEEA